MNLIDIFREANEIYEGGGNIVRHFKSRDLNPQEQIAIIEFAYDLQSGSYTKALASNAEIMAQKIEWGKRIASILVEYGALSIAEAGIGEATTFKFVLDSMGKGIQAGGFDLSLSRLLYARAMLSGYPDTVLFAGELTAIPLVDNAYDAILTNHSLESNGGREREVLAELLRVTRRLLVLVEPDYSRGSSEQKERMAGLGYIRDLHKHLEDLGARILRYEDWDLNLNPLNSASLIVAEKPDGMNWGEPVRAPLASPFSKWPLEIRSGYAFSPFDKIAFPIVEKIPCLLRQNAIVGSHLNKEVIKSFDR